MPISTRNALMNSARSGKMGVTASAMMDLVDTTYHLFDQGKKDVVRSENRVTTVLSERAASLESGIGAVTTKVIALEAALPGAYQPLSAELSALVGAASSPGYSKRTGAASWSMVASIPQADVASSSGWISTALAGREPALGNPATSGYVLASTAAGVRSWVALPSASTTTPSPIGTAAVGTGTTWARADHVHALPATGVAAGSYGSATVVPVPTVDAYGRITAMGTATITPAGIGAAEASVVAYTGTGAVDPNTLTGLQSGYTQATATNRPGNYAFVQTLGRYNGGSMQIASDSYGSDSNSLWWRRKGDNGTWYPWKTIWHTGNLTQTALGGPFLPLSGGTLTGGLTTSYGINLMSGSSERYIGPTPAGLRLDPYGGVVDVTTGSLAISNGNVSVPNGSVTVGTGSVSAPTLATAEGSLRNYPVASTSGCLYGSSVATPDGGNYSLRWTKDGATALLNGTTQSILAVAGSAVLTATASGVTVSGAASINGTLGFPGHVVYSTSAARTINIGTGMVVYTVNQADTQTIPNGSYVGQTVAVKNAVSSSDLMLTGTIAAGARTVLARGTSILVWSGSTWN